MEVAHEEKHTERADARAAKRREWTRAFHPADDLSLGDIERQLAGLLAQQASHAVAPEPEPEPEEPEGLYLPELYLSDDSEHEEGVEEKLAQVMHHASKLPLLLVPVSTIAYMVPLLPPAAQGGGGASDRRPVSTG